MNYGRRNDFRDPPRQHWKDNPDREQDRYHESEFRREQNPIRSRGSGREDFESSRSRRERSRSPVERDRNEREWRDRERSSLNKEIESRIGRLREDRSPPSRSPRRNSNRELRRERDSPGNSTNHYGDEQRREERDRPYHSDNRPRENRWEPAKQNYHNNRNHSPSPAHLKRTRNEFEEEPRRFHQNYNNEPPQKRQNHFYPTEPRLSESSLFNGIPLSNRVTLNYRAAAILGVTKIEGKIHILLTCEDRRVKRKGEGTVWLPTGGKKEIDEFHPISTALREFQEETGSLFGKDFLTKENLLTTNKFWWSEGKYVLFFVPIPFYRDLSSKYLNGSHDEVHVDLDYVPLKIFVDWLKGGEVPVWKGSKMSSFFTQVLKSLFKIDSDLEQFFESIYKEIR